MLYLRKLQANERFIKGFIGLAKSSSISESQRCPLWILCSFMLDALGSYKAFLWQHDEF
jgi:hypothetical protein